MTRSSTATAAVSTTTTVTARGRRVAASALIASCSPPERLAGPGRARTPVATRRAMTSSTRHRAGLPAGVGDRGRPAIHPTAVSASGSRPAGVSVGGRSFCRTPEPHRAGWSARSTATRRCSRSGRATRRSKRWKSGSDRRRPGPPGGLDVVGIPSRVTSTATPSRWTLPVAVESRSGGRGCHGAPLEPAGPVDLERLGDPSTSRHQPLVGGRRPARREVGAPGRRRGTRPARALACSAGPTVISVSASHPTASEAADRLDVVGVNDGELPGWFVEEEVEPQPAGDGLEHAGHGRRPRRPRRRRDENEHRRGGGDPVPQGGEPGRDEEREEDADGALRTPVARADVGGRHGTTAPPIGTSCSALTRS